MREKIRRVLASSFVVLGVFAAVMAMGRAERTAQAAVSPQDDASQVSVGPTDIGGVVTSAKGPEAGVWVIAETTELPTRFRKIVVTDDRGRYLIPDLPKAHYKVWVRGYGLTDSAPVAGEGGKHLALTAVVAPSPQAAAQYYPANYWYSLIQVPPRSAFPLKTDGKVASQQGSPRYTPGTQQTQADWIEGLHSGCEMCHQIGDKATREISPRLGKFDTTSDAWQRRIMSGQFGSLMNSEFNGTFGHDRGFAIFADWTDRIARGEVPPAPRARRGSSATWCLRSGMWGRLRRSCTAFWPRTKESRR